MKDKVGDGQANPIVKEVVINASVSAVWKAITDKDEMRQWYFDIPAFKLEIGSEFQFEGEKDEKHYLHLCKIIEIVPHKNLFMAV